MGVIQRQGFKSSIVSYIGVAIGAISTVYVYPKALEVLGLFRAFYDAAALVGIFVLMGSSVSSIRFFPKLKDKETGHSGLLSWVLMVAGFGFIIFLLIFPFVHHWLSPYFFHEKNKDYGVFIYYLIPLTFFVSLTNLLARYASNFRRVTIPAAFEQLVIKITLPLIMILFLLGWLNVKGVLWCVIGSFAFSAFGLIYYLIHLGEWKLTKPLIWQDKPTLKEYFNYSGYGILSGIGSQVAFRIDSLMVTSMIQLEATGIYAIALALSEIIVKPMRSLSSIAGPVVAHHIENGNMEEVKSIYKKSSINMTIIGVGLFLLIWTVLPFLFAIMPNTEVMRKGTYVVFFLGLAQVWDMMTGVNTEIIYYSRHYRFTLYLTLFLAVVTIGANFVFIPLYGLTGAALATCTSMFLYNLAKLLFIKIKFGFFPFNARIFPVIGFGIAAWLISQWMPVTGHALPDLLAKGFIFSLLYGGAIWKFNLSPDIKAWVEIALSKFKIFKAVGPKS